MRTSNLVALALPAWLVAAAPMVAAQIRISAGVVEGQAWNDAVTFAPTVKAACGRASAAFDAASGDIGAGSANCAEGPGGIVLSQPGAGAAARADASAMSVGVLARAWSNGVLEANGSGGASVRDTLLIRSPLTLNIRLDLDLLASTEDLRNTGRYSFSVVVGDALNDSQFLVFGFNAAEEEFARSASVTLNNGATQILLPAIPDVYEISLPLGLPFLGNQTIQVSANAYAEGHKGGAASVYSFHSAWLGIQGDYSSLNGYAYPGYTAPVPEPGRWALWLAGGAVLAGLARRRAVAGREGAVWTS